MQCSKTPCSGLVWADLLLSPSSSRKLSDLHHRLNCWSFQCRVSSGPASLQTHTYTHPHTHRPLPHALLNHLFVNSTRMPSPIQGSLRKKKTLRAAHAIILRPPVYGILEGFGANPNQSIKRVSPTSYWGGINATRLLWSMACSYKFTARS